MSGGGNMSDKDPGIRLFGRRIPVPECQIPTSSQIPANSSTMNACSSLKKTESEMTCTEKHTANPENSSDIRDSKQESLDNVQENESKAETSSTDQDKVSKKPDKILHCPRCNSLDTKFCYFNNYNVNQPRHFCKNCQRYWTAGGTMRNVPVGAGRRKNKHFTSQYRHILVASDGTPTRRLETRDSPNHQLVSTLESAAVFSSSTDNGAVLKFGPDSPLCESIESILHLRDQKRSNDPSATNCPENGEEEVSLCASSVTSACTQVNELLEHNASKPLPCYPVPPWVFPWNPNWNNIASMAAVHQSSLQMCNPYNVDPASMQWCPMPMVAVPTICPPSLPFHLVPGSYFSGTPMWVAGSGSVSISSNGCLSPSSSTSNSGNSSPTLGKHTRDGVFIDEEKSDMCMLVPKTLRINEPNEASKSPTWAMLNNKMSSSVDAVKPKGEGTDQFLGVSQILEANPAAISRAHAFQESV